MFLNSNAGQSYTVHLFIWFIIYKLFLLMILIFKVACLLETKLNKSNMYICIATEHKQHTRQHVAQKQTNQKTKKQKQV